MILNELIINSFGKFKDKTIKLNEGINIIYGSNEAGKTTIHKFIEGMFFGFFKPYYKRKIYTYDYDKYYPWDGSDYKGIIKYKYNETVYRVERNFNKGNDEVKVFDDKTGEDITHMFVYDNVTRLHEPASLHLGFNSVVYNNTISVKQLGNRTEEDLVKEVKDSLINLGGTLDEEISLKRVVEDLTNQIEKIGKETQVKTSPYGRIVKEIEEFEEEKRNAEAILNDIKEQQERLNKLKDELHGLKGKRQSLENNLKLIDIYKTKTIYIKALKIKSEIEEISSKIEELKEYEITEEDDYTKSIKLDNELENMSESLTKLQNKKKSLENELHNILLELKALSYFDTVDESQEIEDLKSYYTILHQNKNELEQVEEGIKRLSSKINQVNNIDITSLNEDFCLYEEMESERDRLSFTNDSSNKVIYEEKIREREEKLKSLNIYKILFVAGTIITIPLGLLINPLLYLLFAIPVILFIYSIVKEKDNKEYINTINRQLKEIELKERETSEKIRKLEDKMKRILHKYQCTNKMDLRRIVSELSGEAAVSRNNQRALMELKDKREGLLREINKYESIIKKYIQLAKLDGNMSMENVNTVREQYKKYLELKKFKKTLEDNISELSTDIEKLNTEYKEKQNIMKLIFEKNNISNMEEFKAALDKKKKLEKLIEAKKNKEKLYQNTLGDNTLESLKERGEKLNEDMEYEIESLDREIIERELKEIIEDITSKREEISRMEENIKEKTKNIRPLADIKEDIIRKKDIRDKLKEKRDALELARKTIEEISKRIQRDFAPNLNRKVGNIIKSITNSKYSEVKISENLDIKIVEPNTNKLINIENLSGGTIDQIYFAARFGIIDIIKGESTLPLILDDCFVQYDNNRLKNILDFLVKEGTRRQIILFTCHKREKELLDKLNLNYSYIEI